MNEDASALGNATNRAGSALPQGGAAGVRRYGDRPGWWISPDSD
jgi:hypothetical protein